MAHSRQTLLVQLIGQPPPSAMNKAAVSDNRLTMENGLAVAFVIW